MIISFFSFSFLFSLDVENSNLKNIRFYTYYVLALLFIFCLCILKEKKFTTSPFSFLNLARKKEKEHIWDYKIKKENCEKTNMVLKIIN